MRKILIALGVLMLILHLLGGTGLFITPEYAKHALNAANYTNYTLGERELYFVFTTCGARSNARFKGEGTDPFGRKVKFCVCAFPLKRPGQVIVLEVLSEEKK
ncbi:MAG TPA: hypothetical protein VEA59_06460 [Patescibacteria group bacterium]|nr:hypothetical protein [Patescibacteria group bacterium]